MTVFVSPRLATLDLVRTLALALMIAYHTIFDLRVFFAAGPDPLAPQWRLLAIVAATLFLLCSGTSVKLALHTKPAYARWPWLRQRLLRVGAAAFLVTVVSAVVLPHSFVQFGILHCIVIGSLFVFGTQSWQNKYVLLLSMSMLLAPLAFPEPVVHRSFAWLVLGWPSADFQSVDYFPLLPWSGILLAGTTLIPLFQIAERILPAVTTKQLWYATWPGRYSLMIYLVHQPIILLILYGILG